MTIKEISLDGCPVIGAGASGKIYKIDDETIVKVFSGNVELSEVEKEQKASRDALVAGIPTAIPFGIVKADGKIGLIYELLDSDCLADYVTKNPERTKHIAAMHAKLLHDNFSTRLKGDNFPDVKDLFWDGYEILKEYITKGKIMSKICILTGSPRKGGNTYIMTEAFEAAAKEKGYEIKRYDTGAMNIKGCIGCETCYSDGFPCNSIRDDDFNAMAPDILDADVLVFAMPVYWYSFPAQFKAALDRMFCFAVGKQPITGKKYILIACCEEEDETVMDGIKLPLERGAKLLGWEKVGELLVPGVYKKGDVKETEAVEKAAKLAEACV